MITVNSGTGGKTSSYMAVHYPADVNIFACVCIDYPPATPKDPAVLSYVLSKLNGNFIASAERQKTLKVLMDLEQLIGKEIVWVRGKSFDQIIDENSALPTWARRFCTTEMKMLPMFEYLYPRYGKTIHHIGFRADEPERIKNGGQQRTFHRPFSCNNFGEFLQNWMEFEWQEKRFPLRKTFHYEIRKWWLENHPEIDFPWDSNCVGCHHKPNEVIKQNYLEDPEILEWFAMQEDKKLRLDKKNVTWHDDRIPYWEIFKTEYIDLFTDLKDYTMCNSGGCTD
jgi:hypothetical protein